MIDSQFKKEIGFIKMSASNANLREKQPIDSSDSFSSFEYESQHRKDEFSPYRHPVQKGKSKKIVSQQKTTFENHSKVEKKRLSTKSPNFSNLMLRNNFVEETQTIRKKAPKMNSYEHQSITHELEAIEKEIRQVKSRNKQAQSRFKEGEEDEDQEDEEEYENGGKETPTLLNGGPKNDVYVEEEEEEEEEELSLSNINRFRNNNEKEYGSLPLRQEEEVNYPKTLAQYKKYLEESSEEEFQQLRGKATLKHTGKGVQKRQKQHGEELITDYSKKQFKDKSMKRAMLEHQCQNIRPAEGKKGLMEAKGGVSFDVDTRQFKGVQRAMGTSQAKRRTAPTNTKQKLTIRRETAKRFDRESRFRLFGYAYM